MGINLQQVKHDGYQPTTGKALHISTYNRLSITGVNLHVQQIKHDVSTYNRKSMKGINLQQIKHDTQGMAHKQVTHRTGIIQTCYL